ncbi:MAG TPA: CBS domain-containing protein [Geobacteraceae bacterium]|nr:CBS domain-containing protein [Geobacteraceae bacterium]
MKARDIMIKDVPTISRKASLKEAVLLLKKNYGDKSFLNSAPGLVVVNDWGELAGVLMPLTIMQALLEETATTEPSLREEAGYFDLLCGAIKEKLVEDIMEREPISVTEDALLVDIAGLFVKHRFQRIPVVREKKVVGIIYRTPLLFAMTNCLFR